MFLFPPRPHRLLRQRQRCRDWAEGVGQRGGGRGLQLQLLPLHAVPGLSLRHDDPHQLVQVSTFIEVQKHL